jgi:hypothetical protein
MADDHGASWAAREADHNGFFGQVTTEPALKSFVEYL